MAIELGLNKEFDYLVPESLRGCICDGAMVMVPFGKSKRRGYILGLKESSDYGELKEIIEVIGDHALLTPEIMKLARWMASYYAAPLEHAIKTVLPGAVRKDKPAFKKQLYIIPVKGADAGIEALERKAPKQAAALSILIGSEGMLLQELVKISGASASSVKALAEKGYATLSKGSVRRDPHADDVLIRSKPFDLMDEQAIALNLITENMAKPAPKPVLLFGVTGSGKTEVYIQAIAKVRADHKTAIVLVPEISLTPQTVERFRSRFGDEIAVLHSHLSDGERHDEWFRIRDGEASIVIGARSALFAPLKNLGLIIVDEEHEHTYKQEESPRYNARDVAVMRGHFQKCGVILGSATPSIESYHNALQGKYLTSRMTKRIEDVTMPHVRVVDMSLEKEKDGKGGFFSADLIEAVYDRISRSEQTILFLNRRGFTTTLKCDKCAHVFSCENCSIALTYHRKKHELRCHLCGFVTGVPSRCPEKSCQNPEIKHSGLGTEKVEDLVSKVFPKARVMRADSDTMTNKNAYRKLMGDLRSGKIDILIGTQMIAKGLDFPNVTLVGVVNADASLHIPDFRASERTFQLLTQVAGRAGRGEVKGEVIIQSYTPEHTAIQCSRRLDYDGFVDQELAFRKEAFYPPYSHLVCVTVKGENENLVAEYTEKLYQELKAAVDLEKVMLLPASPAPIERIKNEYRYQVLMRAGSALTINRYLVPIVNTMKWPKGLRYAIDVDALSMM